MATQKQKERKLNQKRKPKKEITKTLQIRVPQSQFNKIKKAAFAHEISISKFIGRNLSKLVRV